MVQKHIVYDTHKNKWPFLSFISQKLKFKLKLSISSMTEILWSLHIDNYAVVAMKYKMVILFLEV